jgi:hypothetical protein
MKHEKKIIWNRRKIVYEKEKDIIWYRRKILYESGERYSKEQYITSQSEYITQHYWNIIIKKKEED